MTSRPSMPAWPQRPAGASGVVVDAAFASAVETFVAASFAVASFATSPVQPPWDARQRASSVVGVDVRWEGRAADPTIWPAHPVAHSARRKLDARSSPW